MGLIFNYVHLDRTNKIVDLANSDVIFNKNGLPQHLTHRGTIPPGLLWREQMPMEICPPFYPPYMALPSGNFTLAPWFAGKSPLSSVILPLKPPKGTSGEFLSLPSLLRQRVEKGERPKRRFHFWEIWKYHGIVFAQNVCKLYILSYVSFIGVFANVLFAGLFACAIELCWVLHVSYWFSRRFGLRTPKHSGPPCYKLVYKLIYYGYIMIYPPGAHIAGPIPTLNLSRWSSTMLAHCRGENEPRHHRLSRSIFPVQHHGTLGGT